MLKTIILASSMVVAVPAFAQDAKPAQTTPMQEQTAPATPEAAPVTDDAAPAQTTEQATAATPQAIPAPAEAAAQPATAAAQPAPAAPLAATQDQVAGAVGRQWTTYDKDGDSKLDKAEFGAWMTGLRAAAEPNFKPGTPEAATWEAQAFAAADADKSASVNKQELTVFLTPKAS